MINLFFLNIYLYMYTRIENISDALNVWHGDDLDLVYHCCSLCVDVLYLHHHVSNCLKYSLKYCVDVCDHRHCHGVDVFDHCHCDDGDDDDDGGDVCVFDLPYLFCLLL